MIIHFKSTNAIASEFDYMYQDRNLIAQLFEDWLQSGQSWLKSTTYLNATREKTSRRRGRAMMKQFRELKEMFGLTNAKIIRDKKKAAQLTKGEDEPDYWTVHPELPDAEELLLYYYGFLYTINSYDSFLGHGMSPLHVFRTSNCFGCLTPWPLKMTMLIPQSQESRPRQTSTQIPPKLS